MKKLLFPPSEPAREIKSPISEKTYSPWTLGGLACLFCLCLCATEVKAAMVQLVNPSFETALAGDATKPYGWTLSGTGPTVITRLTYSGTLTPAPVQDGSYALSVSSWTSGVNDLLTEAPSTGPAIIAGETYNAKLHYVGSWTNWAGGNNGAAGHLTAKLVWYAADNAVIGKSITLLDTETLITPGTTFSNSDFCSGIRGYIQANFVAPTGAVKVGFEFTNASWISSNDPFYIDNLTITGNLAPVPEPATLGLLIGGGLVSLLRRRRRHDAN